ncbi:MAG: NAD(P)/FAD-dependent oxidoreductase [Parvibaculum sp.]
MTDEALQYDAIVIGAGHNGLIAASYLAKAGRKTVLLDSSSYIGGAARTAEISPDYLVSTAAHLFSAFPRKIEKDLKLAKHGLIWAARDMPTVALDLQGRHITLTGKGKQDTSVMAKHEPRDAENWQDFSRRMSKFALFLSKYLGEALPDLGNDVSSYEGPLAALQLEKMGAKDLQSFLRFLPSSMSSVLDRYFEGKLLKGALALDAVIGHHAGPYSPGSAFSYIYKQGLAKLGQGLSYPVGGAGAFAEVLGEAAEALGVRIRVDSHVEQILVEDGKAVGVRLTDGTVFHAPVILSSVAPKATCLELVGARHFETDTVRHLSRIRSSGAAAKINLALEGLPTFENFTDTEYGGRLLIAPSVMAVERSFIAAKRNELPIDPVMEMVIPTYHDPRLAPMGHHVLSIMVPNVPYDVAGGWDERRDEFVKKVIDTIEMYAPDLTAKIIAGEMLTPPEIESKFVLSGGHWHHADMSFDQLLAFRPTPGMANYASSLDGLYFCGAGCHPGGGLTGLPGRLAAEAVLAQRKTR